MANFEHDGVITVAVENGLTIVTLYDHANESMQFRMQLTGLVSLQLSELLLEAYETIKSRETCLVACKGTA